MPARRREPLAREQPAELQVAATNGSIVTDSRGRKYIDFVMGWCVGNFGWRPAAIAKAIERFKGPDYVYPGYSYAPWTELARLLASLAPRPLTTCFRATGGSEAVDLALQAAMIHTGRRALLSLEGSYHGNSLAGLSIGASDNREQHQEPAAALRQDCTAARREGTAPHRAAAEAARRRRIRHGADQHQSRRPDSRERRHPAGTRPLPPLRHAVHRR